MCITHVTLPQDWGNSISIETVHSVVTELLPTIAGLCTDHTQTLLHYIYIKPSFRLAGHEMIADIIWGPSAPAEQAGVSHWPDYHAKTSVLNFVSHFEKIRITYNTLMLFYCD